MRHPLFITLMYPFPKTSKGKAHLALRMIAQAQYDSRLLETKVFSLLFEHDLHVLELVNEHIRQDPELARVVLSANVKAQLETSTLEAATLALEADLQLPLFPWLKAA
jgi:hypothetical protein